MVVTLGVCLVGAASAMGDAPRARTLTWDADRGAWVEAAPPQAGTAEGDRYAIQMLVKAGRHRKALAAIKRFTKRYGDDGAEFPSVLIAQAEALMGLRRHDKAYEVLRRFFKRHARSPQVQDALRVKFMLAEAYLRGAKRRVLGLPIMSGVDRAYEMLDALAIGYPDDPLAELAIKTQADHLFSVGDFDLAETAYTRLIEEHPNSRYHQYCLRRAADAALARFPGVAYDDTALVEAGERYDVYRLRYPAVADREGVGLIQAGIRSRRADKQFAVGRYYERTGHIGSAVFYYRRVVERFAGTVAAARATGRLELLQALEPAGAARDAGDKVRANVASRGAGG